MIPVVRDSRGVTHAAVLLPDEPGGPPVIGSLCEQTVAVLLSGRFTTWAADELEDGLPNCMSCLVRHDRADAERIAP